MPDLTTKMRLATLVAALAVAAEATLNVTLTNNLVGVTTVRVAGAGLRVDRSRRRPSGREGWPAGGRKNGAARRRSWKGLEWPL